MSFYSERVHKARKDHWCLGCGNPIPVGAHYLSTCGLFEGEFWDAKLCSDCVEHLDNCDGCLDAMQDGWGPGDLGEWRSECGYHANPCIILEVQAA